MKKEVKFIHGLIPVLALAVAMLSAVVLWGAEPQIPLAVGCMAAGIVAWRLGWTWDEILAGMLDGIKQSLEAVLILMAIGILISAGLCALLIMFPGIITLRDESGAEYRSCETFGNATDRRVAFDEPDAVAKLCGRAVTLRAELCEADLYAMRFCR